MIHFTVPLIPTAKGRPRFGRVGTFVRTFTPAKTERAERDFIALAAEHAPPAPIGGPVEVQFCFVLPIPRGWPRWKQEAAVAGRFFHTSKPDLDNLEKLALDALQRSGQFFRDDAQITRTFAEKRYGVAPGTTVTIAEKVNATAADFPRARKPKTTPDLFGAGQST